MQTLINSVVTEAMEALQEALQAYNNAASRPGAIVRGIRFNAFDGQEESGATPLELLHQAINTWDIGAESENGSVIRFPGAFEVTWPVIEAAQELNQAKACFSQAIAKLESEGADSRQIRSAYRACGYPRIHPLQAWRQIVVLSEPNLFSIGFTVAKRAYSIEVMSTEQAISRLSDANAQDVVEQISGLPSDSCIHWHTPVTRHIRANVVWRTDESRASRMYHASLPFLVPEGNWPAKRVRFNEPRSHAVRKDQKGVIQAFLPLRKGAYISVS